MKILFVFAPYLFLRGLFDHGKKYDFVNLRDNPRGLTGSEVSCFQIAKQFALKDHDVAISTTLNSNRINIWENVNIIPMDNVDDIKKIVNGDWDVVYSWNEVNVLRYVNPNSLRMINLQINDLDHGEDGYDDYVDIYTSPSESHKSVIGKLAPNLSKWEVVPNGCYLDIYDKLNQNIIDGRIIYASSPDRGLHWLLQIWPSIRKAVPEAHLKIFYEIQSWINRFNDIDPISVTKIMAQLSCRARYIKEAFRRFGSNSGIEVIGSVSRNQIAKEFAQAQILAYPCDTVSYTEGFSVTLMEACASKTVPITTDVDALGEIYGSAVPMVHAPIEPNLDEYRELVIRALTDYNFRQEVISKARQLAEQYTWDKVADKVLDIIEKRRK